MLSLRVLVSLNLRNHYLLALINIKHNVVEHRRISLLIRLKRTTHKDPELEHILARKVPFTEVHTVTFVEVVKSYD